MKWNFFLNELKTFNTHIFAILDFCHSGKALNDTVADRGGKRYELIQPNMYKHLVNLFLEWNSLRLARKEKRPGQGTMD